MKPANSIVSPASRISTASRPLLITGASRPPPGGPSPKRGRLEGKRRIGIAATVDCRAISVKRDDSDYGDRDQRQDHSKQNRAQLAVALIDVVDARRCHQGR